MRTRKHPLTPLAAVAAGLLDGRAVPGGGPLEPGRVDRVDP